MFQQHSQKDLPSTTIFTKFMNFLCSSMWNIPIATFLEQRSVVFDRERDDPSLYKKIHGELESLVDTLIEGFCYDLNIEAEQLLFALKHEDNSHKLSAKERNLLEPVIAAQNYDVFVPMMMRKNIDLQLQAVQMIEFLCGVIPSVLCVEGNDIDEGELLNILTSTFEPAQYDRYIVIKVLRKSKAEFERDKGSHDETKIQLEEAMKLTLQEKERLEKCKQKAENEINKALTQSADDTKEASPGIEFAGKVMTKSADLKEVKKLSKVKGSERRSSEHGFFSEGERKEASGADKEMENEPGITTSRIHALLRKPAFVPEDDVEERAAYFHKQRDELLRMKRAVREQQFQVIAENAKKERPRTAKAARDAMSGKTLNSNVVDKTVIEARRALVRKLKDEIKQG